MYFPTLEQVKERSGEGNLIPVYREILADMETPVSAFLKIARGPHSFLLESVEGSERIARYSFIGTEPYRVLRTGPGEETGAIDPLVPIQQELEKYRLIPLAELPRFHGEAVGYLAYEAVRYFEKLPSPAMDENLAITKIQLEAQHESEQNSSENIIAQGMEILFIIIRLFL